MLGWKPTHVTKMGPWYHISWMTIQNKGWARKQNDCSRSIHALINPGSWFNIMMSSYQCRKSHCGDKMFIISSYPHDGILWSVLEHVYTVYPKKYAHGFVVLCFVVVMQLFIMNSHEVFIHIHQGCFAGTGAIVKLPQCQWSKPDGYGKISQCITTTKHSKAKTVCIFLGIYCMKLLTTDIYKLLQSI